MPRWQQAEIRFAEISREAGPFYVWDEADDHLRFADRASFYSPFLYGSIQPMLARDGRDRGPGKAVFIDHNNTLTPVRYSHVVAHEGSHCYAGPPAPIETMQVSEWPVELLATAQDRTKGPRATKTYAHPWRFHEAAWIRCALHVSFRSRRLGSWITPQDMGVAGRYYGLSAPAKYERALLGELHELEEMPLSQICTIKPPDAFLKVWESDTDEPTPVTW
jgi:hypothetical protein